MNVWGRAVVNLEGAVLNGPKNGASSVDRRSDGLKALVDLGGERDWDEGKRGRRAEVLGGVDLEPEVGPEDEARPRDRDADAVEIGDDQQQGQEPQHAIAIVQWIVLWKHNSE